MTKLYLAPIRGITDDIYRTAFATVFGGIDLAIAPYISTVKKDFLKSSHLKNLAKSKNDKMVVIPQILGNNADDLILLCRELADMGYDSVNWNIGCPYPMVTNKKCGSGILPYPEKIEEVLSKVLPAVSQKFSIKTRIGLVSNEEIFSVIPVLNQFPLEEVIVHPRTGKQIYRGRADVEIFAAVLSKLKHKVIYNGDITDSLQLKDLQKRFPELDEWMIGRALLSNPYLPLEIKEDKFYSDEEKRKNIKKFHDILYDRYQERLFGSSHLLDKMKANWFYLHHGFSDGKKLYKKIAKVKRVENYEDMVGTFFNK